MLSQMYDDSLKPQITSFMDSLESSSFGASLADILDAIDESGLLDSPDFELLIHNIVDYRGAYGNVTLLSNVVLLIEALRETDIYQMSDLEDYLNMSKLNHLVASTAFVDKIFAIDFIYSNINESLKSEDVYDSIADALSSVVTSLGYDVTFTGESISLADAKYGIYDAEGEINIDEIRKLFIVGTNYDWSMVDTSSTEAMLASVQDVLFTVGFSGQRTVDAIFNSNLVVALFDRLLNFKYNAYTGDMVDVVNQIVQDAGIDVTIPVELLYYDETAFDGEVLAKEALIQIVEIMQYVDFSQPLGLDTLYQYVEDGHAGAVIASPIISSLMTNLLQNEAFQLELINLANSSQTFYQINAGFYALPEVYLDNGLVNEAFIIDVLTIAFVGLSVYEVADRTGIIDLATSGADPMVMVDELLTDYMGGIKEIVGVIFNEEKVNETLERVIPNALVNYDYDDAQLQAVLQEIFLDQNDELAFDIETEINRLLDIVNIMVQTVDLSQIASIGSVEGVGEVVYNYGSLSDAQYQVLINLVESSELLSRADQASAAYAVDLAYEYTGLEIYVPSSIALNKEFSSLLNLVRVVSLYVVEQEDLGVELEDIDLLPLLSSGDLLPYLMKDGSGSNSDFVFYNMVSFIKYIEDVNGVAELVSIPDELASATIESAAWQAEMNQLIEAVFALTGIAEGTSLTLSYNDLMGYLDGTSAIGSLPVELATQFADAQRVEDVFGPLFDSLIVSYNVPDYVSKAADIVAPLINDYELTLPSGIVDVNGYVDGAAILDLIHVVASFAADMNVTLGYAVVDDAMNFEEIFT